LTIALVLIAATLIFGVAFPARTVFVLPTAILLFRLALTFAFGVARAFLILAALVVGLALGIVLTTLFVLRLTLAFALLFTRALLFFATSVVAWIGIGLQRRLRHHHRGQH
jgi:hypothetical protein